MKRTRTAVLVAVLGAAGLLAGCRRTPQQREARYLKTGLEMMQKQDYSRAILNFLSAAQAMPKDAEPQYQLGLAYLATHNVVRAAPALRRATELNPQHWQANLKLAEIMATTHKKELLDDAADRIHKVLSALPDNAEAADALAVTEIRQGNAAKGAERLEETLKKMPTHLESSVLLAKLKLAQKDYVGAEQVLEKAAAGSPREAAPAVALAQIYLLTGGYDKAEAQARKALALQPKSAEALWTLAAAQMARHQADAAAATYQELAALPDKRLRAVHALYLYQSGKRDAALAEFEQLARQHPDERELRTQLIAACLEMNRTDEAAALLAAALKKNPKDMDALFQRSEMALRAGNAPDAERDLNEVLKFQPDSAVAHDLLAIVFRSLGLDESARQELNDALKLNPGLVAARLELARDLRRAGKPKAAVEVLDDAPAAQKRIAAIVVERNWALIDAGESQQVRAILDKLLPAANVPEIVLQDAVLKMVEHDYAGARASADQALRSNPEDVRAAQAIAQSYAAQNQSGKALERLKEIAAARPRSGALAELLGSWYLGAGKLAEARAAFEAAKANETDSSSAELALAELDRRQAHLAGALERVNRVLAAQPHNLRAALMLADYQTELGDKQSAMADYESALKIDDSNLVALNNLAYLMAPENPQQALQLALKAAQRAPNNAAVEDTLGWVYYRQGNYSEARTYLKAAYDKDPTARHQFHLALSCLKAGDQVTGGKLLEAALQRDPNLPKTEAGW